MKTGIKYSVIGLLSLFYYIEAAFRCDYKYSTKAKGWFKHVLIPAPWADARLHCMLEGAVLAIPQNSNIEAEMKDMINKFFLPKTEIYTGFHATFSQGFYYSTEGIPLDVVEFTWADNEPSNTYNVEHCITFNGNGKISDKNCKNPQPYICYRSSDKKTVANECGTVDPEYRMENRTKSCYKFHTVPRTFNRAHFACSAEGGHLAIINSDVEATVLKELFAKYPSGTMFGSFWKDMAFIGFHDWGDSGDWRTIHGQTLQEAGYSKFSNGEPNNSTGGESCGAIYRSALLNDHWCSNPVPFICEKRPDYPAVCNAS